MTVILTLSPLFTVMVAGSIANECSVTVKLFTLAVAVEVWEAVVVIELAEVVVTELLTEELEVVVVGCVVVHPLRRINPKTERITKHFI
jgi:hypothetical protein